MNINSLGLKLLFQKCLNSYERPITRIFQKADIFNKILVTTLFQKVIKVLLGAGLFERGWG